VDDVVRDSLRRSRRKFEPNESVRLARREVVRARGGEEEEGEEEERRCFFVRRRAAERERERVERSAVFGKEERAVTIERETKEKEEEERRRCFFVRRRAAERERERVERSAVFERKTLNPREKKKSR